MTTPTLLASPPVELPFLLMLSPILCLVLWLFAYALILRQAHADKTYGMPFMALCFNVAWEAIFSLVVPHPGAGLFFLWLIVDIFLLWQFFRYGQRDFPRLLSGRMFLPTIVCGLGLGVMYVLAVSAELGDWYGTYSSWGQVTMMSVLFVSMLARRESSAGQNLYIGLARMFGTLAMIPGELYIHPGSPFLACMYVASPLIDLVYCVLLYQVLKAEGRNPWHKGLPRRFRKYIRN